MANLLQSQIQNSCKLAMPEGLKELMSDISREVIRSQPENLYQFITDYLEALLYARETLSIACRICGEICSCSCIPELDYELQCIGLSPEDVDKAKKIIQEHFDKGQVKESNLLIKLAKKTSVTETQLGELETAIHRAYRRHILKRKDRQVSFAKPRKVGSETSTESSVDTESSASDFYKPSYSTDGSATIDMQTKELCLSARYHNCEITESAATLAGSYVHLPMKEPYSVHKVKESTVTLAGSYVDSPMKTPYSARKVTESTATLAGAYVDSPMKTPYSTHKVTESTATLAGSYIDSPMKTPYSTHKVTESTATLAGSYIDSPMKTPYSARKATESTATLAGAYVDSPMKTPYSTRKVTESTATLAGSYVNSPMKTPYSARKVTESTATLAGSYVDSPMKTPYFARKVTESTATLAGSYVDSPMKTPYFARKVTESTATLAGSYVDLPMKVPYSVHDSEENVGAVPKNNACALNILKTLLFTEGQSNSHRRVTDRSDHAEHPSIVHFNDSNYKGNDNEDINDTIENIIHVCQAPLRNLDESQNGFYKTVKENLDESSSGSS